MGAQEQRDELDVLVRHIQQVSKDWPERSPRLAAALEAGQQAANVGIDVDAALTELQAAWGESGPAVAPEPIPEPPEPEAEPEAEPVEERSTRRRRDRSAEAP